MDFFSKSSLAPKSRTMQNGVSSIHYKANVVGSGAFQYNREIVVRRIPCEGLVSNIVCECRTLIEVTRALAPSNEESAYALQLLTTQNDILAALPHRFRG